METEDTTSVHPDEQQQLLDNTGGGGGGGGGDQPEFQTREKKNTNNNNNNNTFQTVKNLAKSIDEFSVLPFYLSYVIVLATLLGGFLGASYYSYMTPFIAFVLVPIFDLVLPPLKLNPTPEQEKLLEKQLRYQVAVWVWVPVQILTQLYICHTFCSRQINLLECFGLMLSVGILGATSINVAHELGHKLSKTEKLLAKTSLAFVSYMHFQIEHVQGHHWNVATPSDPATSRLGESLYTFYWRTVIGSYRSAWSIESKRLEKEKKVVWSVHNQMLWFVFWPVLITLCYGGLFGLWGSVFFVVQSIIGFSFLEVVNYIEHYGLLRLEVSPGKYEPVRPIHSWNADETLSNYLLFKLQRHSDHHTFPVRKYQVLRSFEESPQLPTGYSGCILLALVPPLWRYVMDPRVIEARKMIERYRTKSG